MKHLIKVLLLVMAMFLPSVAHGREDELAEILEKCLLREMNSPDSIEYNLAHEINVLVHAQDGCVDSVVSV